MRWTYDPRVNVAYIHLNDPEGEITTLDLDGVQVMLDVDSAGNLAGIKLLGLGVQIVGDELTQVFKLLERLKEEK